MGKTKAFLEDTRQRIATEDTWTKVAYCKDKNGKRLSVYDVPNDDIVCWCAYGSILKSHKVLKTDSCVFVDSLVALTDNIDESFHKNFKDGALPSDKLMAYNDHDDTTHADIMGLFDKTIDTLEVN